MRVKVYRAASAAAGVFSPEGASLRFPVGSRAYEPRGAARELWKNKDPEILIEGPAGTGKSRGALEKAHLIAMKYPGCRILLVRKTRESLSETVLVTYEEKVVQADFPALYGPQRNFRQSYKYPNGSIIVVGGLDKSTRIMSSDYDIIILFEGTEASEEDFENLTTRLRNGMVPYQQIIVDCNPTYPSHWLNKRASRREVMTRLRSRHQDNPILYNVDGTPTAFGANYIARLSRLTGARKSRLLKGLWAAAEGSVYPDFSEDIHSGTPLIKYRADVPASWRRIRVIDFGFINPFVCQWWAIDEDKRMYLYREIYFSRRLVADHAETIQLLSAGEEIEATICDHDAEDRATLERAGIPTQPAFKAIEPGIEAVRGRLLVQEDGRPRIFFLPDALHETDPELVAESLPTKTTAEFDGYSYPQKKEGKTPKEVPEDRDNHGMDTMRYGVAYVDGLEGLQFDVCMDEATVVNSENTYNQGSVLQHAA
jgi:phage terminase large subunit